MRLIYAVVLLGIGAGSMSGQAPVMTNSSLLPAAIAATSYSFTFSATGAATITWTATGLPGSSALSTSGVLTWASPTVGSTVIHVTATNGSGSAGPTDFTLVVLAASICTGSSPTWVCGDSGNETLNGRALMATVMSGNLTNWNAGHVIYSCGDTITLAAGGRYGDFIYENGHDYVRYFQFPQQSCGAGQTTRLVSSSIGSIPTTLKTGWPNANLAGKQAIIANFAQLVGEPTSAGWDLSDSTKTASIGISAQNYYFGGIAFAAATGTQTGFMNFAALASELNNGPLMTTAQLSNNIEVDRCFVGNQEDYVYGSVPDWYDPTKNAQADVNTWETHYRAGNVGIQLEGNNWNVHDSPIVTSGFDPSNNPASHGYNPQFTCSGGTNASPAVINCTGISALLGITASGGACNPSAPVFACYPDHGQYAVFKGATGGWAGLGKLNGVKYLVYVDADHVSVFEGWKQQSFATPLAIDSTSWGSFSGSVQGKATSGTIASVQYGIASAAGASHVIIEDNFIDDQGGSANIFTGGAWSATDNRANMLAGSVCNNATTASNTCVLNLSQVANLNVGDWVYVSTTKGEQTGVGVTSGNLTNIVVSGTSATVNFTTLPPNVTVGQRWIVRNATGASSLNTLSWPVTSIGSTSFVLDVTGSSAPNGTYNNAGIYMNSRPPNCWSGFSDNINCVIGNIRVGIVTNIAGNAVTLTGANVGFEAVDPGAVLDITSSGTTWTLGGTFTLGQWTTYIGLNYQCLITTCTGRQPDQDSVAWSSYASKWNGVVASQWKISANTLYKEPWGYGKSYVEFKSGNKILLSGNLACCTGDYDLFFEIHNQGNDPWQNASAFNMDSNICGTSPGGYVVGSCYRWIMVGQDPESSNMPAASPRMTNNISADIVTCTGCSTNNIIEGILGNPGVLVSHNTFIPTALGIPAYHMYSGTDVCTHGPSLGTYLQSPGAVMSANILGYGIGLNFEGLCDPFPVGINNNLIWNDEAQTMPGWVASQSNAVVTTKTAMGFVGACSTSNYLLCALDPTSAYKGSMPDGSDPGADVYRVQDLQNRWSELAGLLVWQPSSAALINNPAAFSGTSMRYTITSGVGSCSMKLYDNLARTTLNADTNSAPRQACNRAGNSLVGSLVTFNFGAFSALTVGHTYSYYLVDGARTMVGTFVAANPPVSGYSGRMSGIFR